MAFPTEVFKNAVIYEVKDGIAVIRLNQPEKMNVMSGPINAGVQCALDLASADHEVRVVVFTGTGRAFCAGGNLGGDEKESASGGFKAREGAKVPGTVTTAVRNLRMGMSSSELLRNMDKPTIAAVNGACAGAGFAWACACDLRFAAESAVFKSAFVTAGLSGDYGGTWTLPRIVGPAKARELYFLNRKVSPTDAKAIGLVSDIFPDSEFMARVMEEAKSLASMPPLALKRIKQNLLEADRLLSFSEALDGEAERHARSAFHPDAAEAAKAFVQKRAGNY
eukprot:CAMPEP_0180781360 /NCGR_PEP_ID=MMETSP1038_2-20121128/47609_1 /TAXON_ID=632150 /ORGANISM="Azadinium spinosum, Strain 3D9" /LENGTH=279 /DNA_ID=CAMNT_0022817177 /DNA_START=40 /DNA_END=876 /DNA_ORIENTATION=-